MHHKISFASEKELRFYDPRKFGVVWYGREEKVKREKYLANLGGVIKSLLLRQDIISGIGNIIADEALYRQKYTSRLG